MRTALASRERSTSEGEESLSGVAGAFLAATTGGAVLAHRLLPTLSVAHPEEAVILVVGVAAVVVAGWWAANVAAWMVALRSGRSLVRFTLPGTRRLAHFVLAVWLSSACVAEPDQGPAMVLVEAADDIRAVAAQPTAGETSTTTALDSTSLESTSLESTALDDSAVEDTAVDDTAPTIESTTPTSLVEHTPAADGALTAPPVERPPASVPPNHENDGEGPADVVIPAHQVVVSLGDNLWALSAEALARHGVADLDTPTIAHYWRLVVAGNNVRSGDADVIVPGETINLPAHTLQL